MWATIMVAFYPLPNQYWGDKLIGTPKWAGEHYDIDAKVAPEDIAAWQHQGRDNEMLRSMLQAALRERCHLQIHTSTIAAPIFHLVVNKKGPKGLALTKSGEVPPPNSVPMPAGGRVIPSSGDLRIFGMSMASLAAFLTPKAGLPVFDETHLAGFYDFTLARTEDSGGVALAGANSFDFSALGLELSEPPVKFLVLTIDHMERPSPN